jgi:septum formation protein
MPSLSADVRLVLASGSPRRRALLSDLGLEFDVIISGAEEIFTGKPEEMVVINARAKRDDVARQLNIPSLIIAADTLVFLEQHVLGKPKDAGEACQMLSRLSGRTHQVITGLSIVDTSAHKSAEGFEATDVTFRALAKEEIERFVATVNPIDRAGAYTVDGPGSLLVARYDGCYQNVLGLPMVRLDLLLRQMGYNLFDMMDPAHCRFL